MKRILFAVMFVNALLVNSQENIIFSNDNLTKQIGITSAFFTSKLKAFNSIRKTADVYQKCKVLQINFANPLIDSTYSYAWDKNKSNWSQIVKTDGRIVFSYDTNGNKINSTCKYNDASGKSILNKTDYSYDINNNLTKELVTNTDPLTYNLYVETERDWTYDLKNNLTFKSTERKGMSSVNNVSTIEDLRRVENQLDQYIFDQNNNQTSSTHKNWNTAWVNSIKDSSIYNSNNKISSKLSYKWNTISKAWVNSIKETTIYDIHGYDSVKLVQVWKSTIWVDSVKTITSFVINGKLEQGCQTTQKSINGTWSNTMKVIFTIDLTDMNAPKTISMLMQQWTVGAWSDLFRYTNISYRDGYDGMFTYSADMWINNAWVNVSSRIFNGNVLTEDNGFSKTITTYDTYFKVLNELVQNNLNNKWTTISLKTAKYNANNLAMYNTIKQFVNDTVSLSDSTVYYYHNQLTENQKLKQNIGSISLFPNPNDGYFKVNSSDAKVYSIEVYNVSGLKVYCNTRINQIISDEIDLSDLPKGVYFVKIIGATQTVSQKIIIK